MNSYKNDSGDTNATLVILVNRAMAICTIRAAAMVSAVHLQSPCIVSASAPGAARRQTATALSFDDCFSSATAGG